MSEPIKVLELTFLSGVPPKLKGMRGGMHMRDRGAARAGYEISYWPGDGVYKIRQFSPAGKQIGWYQIHGGPSILAELELPAAEQDIVPTEPVKTTRLQRRMPTQMPPGVTAG